MNGWDYALIRFGLPAIFVIGTILSVSALLYCVARKEKKKLAVLSLSINLMLFGVALWFSASHGTWYRFNDWHIVGQSIHAIEEEYGPFDLGTADGHTAKWAAYYIYTDNGPIMPDHLEHYYYMEYDEYGVVYRVYDGCRPGG